MLCLLLGGCSNAPVVDLLDWIKPGQLRADPKVPPTGGVCQPPLPILNAPVAVPVGGPVAPVPPGSVIPPPAPWPSTGGAPAVPSIPVPSVPPPPPGINF